MVLIIMSTNLLNVLREWKLKAKNTAGQEIINDATSNLYSSLYLD